MDFFNGLCGLLQHIAWTSDSGILIKKQAARTDGFKDTRSTNSGRPPVKELSLEEQLERLKHKNMVLQQENDFLKRVRFINKKQIVKQSKNKQ